MTACATQNKIKYEQLIIHSSRRVIQQKMQSQKGKSK